MSATVPNPAAHAAEERVALPAWGLIVCGLVGAVSSVLLGLLSLFAVAEGELSQAVGVAEVSTASMVLVAAAQGLMSMVILTGGWRARVLEGYTHARVAAALLACPCCVFVGCLPLNVFIGVWALLRLREPGVRAAFV